ncbi:MAG: hypothetical protein IJP38_04555 [Oscillospiraceae bacterium]|nr:hypothetical protein [Oscillospiraceae bacterium]
MSNRNIVIPVKYNTFGYDAYCGLIRPYLDVFGMPYDEVELSSLPERLNKGAALVLIAQPGLILSDDAARTIMDALENGIGLVCTDTSALCNAVFSPICSSVDMPSPVSGGSVTITAEHYATRYHSVGEKIALYSGETFYKNANLKNSTALANIGKTPLLEIAEYNGAKIALWNTVSWIKPEILGPLHGMDDIFRDTIVWAAKKPFAMKGMPPFVGMRVDDVWGAWRDKSPDNPLLWIEISNKYGFKPWLGVFQDNTNEKTVSLIKKYVDDGIATAFPHAFAGCEWVASDIPEHWAYFDHRNSRPWSDEVMAENAGRIKSWYDKNGIAISKVALPHYYETGENALQYFIEWGCEYIGIHMPPDASYFSGAKLRCGPYRKYSQFPSGAKLPVYFADYLEFPHNPKLDGKLFNCVTEIRDVRGYELAPTNDVENTIESGITQLRRAILSSVPAVLFTHESCWIQRITIENWEKEMAAIAEGISDLNPIYDTMDNICRYVRASHDIKIENAELDTNGELSLSFIGKNDIETKCVVFSEKNGEITEKWNTVPKQL